jgi:hypothetical protein
MPLYTGPAPGAFSAPLPDGSNISAKAWHTIDKIYDDSLDPYRIPALSKRGWMVYAGPAGNMLHSSQFMPSPETSRKSDMLLDKICFYARQEATSSQEERSVVVAFVQYNDYFLVFAHACGAAVGFVAYVLSQTIRLALTGKIAFDAPTAFTASIVGALLITTIWVCYRSVVKPSRLDEYDELFDEMMHRDLIIVSAHDAEVPPVAPPEE